MTNSEISKIKDEATQKAVQILEDRYNPEQIRNEGYNDAICDAQKYFILCGCKVLNKVFKFGPKRLEQFIDEVAELKLDTEDGTISLEALEKWFNEYTGMKLEERSVEDALNTRQEEKNGPD